GTVAEPIGGGGTVAEPIGGGGTVAEPIGGGGTVAEPIGGGGTVAEPIGGGGTVPQPILGSPGIVISPASGLVTTEAGGTDQFTIRLNRPPTADVKIGLRSSNEAEGVISTDSITFNSVNWNQWQPITITGVDDKRPEFDRDKNYQIVTAPAVSADSDYNGLNAPDALVVNRDNEISSFNNEFNNNLPQSFTEVAYSFTSNELDLKIPGYVGANAWGDYDNDGDLDLLVMEGGSVQNNYSFSFPRSQYTPKVYSNDNGSFTPVDIGLPTVYGGLLQENGKEHNSKPSATWGDSDNDGDLDILLIGVRKEINSSGTESYIPTTTLWANPKIENNRPPNSTGDTTKFAPAARLPGMFNGSADWGDYNNDGRKDLVLTGDTSSGYITKVFRNDRIDFGGGIPFNYGIRFEEDTEVSLPGVIGNAAWGDYNNDGKPDILVAGETAGSAYVAKLYSNTGNGFTEERNPLLQNQNNLNQPITYGAWGDSNSDGQLDILLTGTKQGPSFTRVLLNNSNYQETKFEDRLIPSGPNAGFGAWGDEDNDGDLDILLTQTDSGKGVAKVYRNESDSFEPIDDPTLPNNVYGPTSWGDYNKDGRLDIALTTRDDSSFPGGSFVKVYRNDTPDANTPPSTPQPQFLQSINTPEGVLLTWRPAESSTSIDSKTPDRGLSYNLKVWATPPNPNAGDQPPITEYIVGPMSGDNGTRQVVQLGNVNQPRDYLYGEYSFLLKPDYLIPAPSYDPNYSYNPQTYEWSVQAIDSAWAGSPFVKGPTFTAPPESNLKPTVTISATDPNAAEIALKYPEEAPNPGKFTITRTGGSLVKPLDVYYSLDIFDNLSYTPKPGTAIPGMDYELFSESDPSLPFKPRQPLPVNQYGWNIITIPAGKRSVNIDVDVRDGIVDDILVEGDEQVVITLDPFYNDPNKVKIGESSSATVTIADNDPNTPPVLNYGPDTTPWHYESKTVSNSPSTFNYQFPSNTFTDPDLGDTLTYTATLENGDPLPDWLIFDPDTRTFNGTNSQPQDFNIKLIARDRAGATASDTIQLIMNDSRFEGTVIDGYISGATLFLDANKNGIKDTNEPSTTTDSGGKFNLNIPFEIFDTNKNGEIDPSEGNLVATGGIDTATGLPLETPVTAPPDSSVVTLLTSLIADLIDKGIEPEEAQSLVKAALSLPAEVDLTSLDPILATNNNQPGGVEVLSAMVKVQNFITQASALIDGASSAVNTDIVKAVVSSITAQIQSGTVLNLSNAAALEPIIQQAAAKIQQIDPSFNTQQVSQITSQSATVMATANQRIDVAVSNPTATSIPESLARLQQVALGPTTQEFKEVGTGNKPISQVVADNTGTALDSRVEAVELPTGIATPVVSGDADLGSNSPNAILGTNGDDILTGDSGNNVLMGMRGNDSLDGVLGNDTIFGGKGSDTILGSSGDDVLFGNRGADILNGDDGNDMLYGGKGDDLLNGGLGIDTLVGGMGLDKFLLSTNSGTDTITDFEVGKDLLVVGNGLIFSQLAIAQDSGATLIRLAQTGEVLASLGGVSANSISAANFGLI
ncbi:FG-GAP-like repeat-containing protein, partial [Microcoleus sp. D3_18a_C4]|uniref:FG-GAP-like repeat-containing protein n=1 Tax=Microcoleus sp. D3_18a_C4 TaxID=3055332 RepID=UPI002FCE93E0